VKKLLAAAGKSQALANRISNVFFKKDDLFPWIYGERRTFEIAVLYEPQASVVDSKNILDFSNKPNDLYLLNTDLHVQEAI
jgi:hypothetical protein